MVRVMATRALRQVARHGETRHGAPDIVTARFLEQGSTDVETDAAPAAARHGAGTSAPAG